MNWEHVQKRVRKRRAELGLSQRKAAERADISPTTWGTLETHGQQVAASTAAAMSRALRWTPDSIERLAAGEEPEEAAPDLGSFRDRAMTSMKAEAHALVEQMSWSELFELIVAGFWIRERTAQFPMDEWDGMTAAEAPSLDALMWSPPALEDAEDIIFSQWERAARLREERTLATMPRDARGRLIDPDDATYAAQGEAGGDPGDQGTGADAARPSPAVEPEGP